MTDDERKKILESALRLVNLPDNVGIFLVLLSDDDDYIVHIRGCPQCFYNLIQEWAEKNNIDRLHNDEQEIVH